MRTPTLLEAAFFSAGCALFCTLGACAVRSVRAPTEAASDLVWLTQLGPRPTGSRALEAARSGTAQQLAQLGLQVATTERAEAASSPGALVLAEDTHNATGVIVLAAPLDTAPSDARIEEQSSGAAAVLIAAQSLRADPPALGLRVALLGGERSEPAWQGSAAAADAYRGAALVVYVNRACALPVRRDVLSHRVLRERFFRAAGSAPAPGRYEQSDAPQAELAAAGARRILALDAPAEPNASCDPAPLAAALARFVRDASQLLGPRSQAPEGLAFDSGPAPLELERDTRDPRAPQASAAEPRRE